jgi:hypothetical protein
VSHRPSSRNLSATKSSTCSSWLRTDRSRTHPKDGIVRPLSHRSTDAADVAEGERPQERTRTPRAHTHNQRPCPSRRDAAVAVGHAFDPLTGRLLATLRGTDGAPITVDGLWGLLPRSGSSAATTDVWLSAGPGGESHGLLGVLRLG